MWARDMGTCGGSRTGTAGGPAGTAMKVGEIRMRSRPRIAQAGGWGWQRDRGMGKVSAVPVFLPLDTSAPHRSTPATHTARDGSTGPHRARGYYIFYFTLCMISIQHGTIQFRARVRMPHNIEAQIPTRGIYRWRGHNFRHLSTHPTDRTSPRGATKLTPID